MLKSYVIMPALCSILKTMHNARYNARLICAGLFVIHTSVPFDGSVPTNRTLSSTGPFSVQ